MLGASGLSLLKPPSPSAWDNTVPHLGNSQPPGTQPDSVVGLLSSPGSSLLLQLSLPHTQTVETASLLICGNVAVSTGTTPPGHSPAHTQLLSLHPLQGKALPSAYMPCRCELS